ncbi:hypothetical protein [Actinomyces procaprae]|uniref:hypothetical protein n=1 Tax=Actinomyces procaprae TaxID=2560010 RepID=UPI00109E294F|nr:hypothetical protein [Actinomyces procaprae]
MTVSGGRSQEVVESVPGAPVPRGRLPRRRAAAKHRRRALEVRATHQCPYGTISSPTGVRPIWLKCLDAPADTTGGTTTPITGTNTTTNTTTPYDLVRTLTDQAEIQQGH